MKRKSLKTRLYLIAAIILLAGLGSAVLIYQTAGNDSDNGLGYPGLDDSRMYRHDLELYGGKFNLITDEFMRWFAGLWHGKTLAYTITWITAIASFGLFMAARHFSGSTDTRAEDKRLSK